MNTEHCRLTCRNLAANTAAFSAALGDAGISCNVLAGYHQDHLLVPVTQREAALAVLRELAGAEG